MLLLLWDRWGILRYNFGIVPWLDVGWVKDDRLLVFWINEEGEESIWSLGFNQKASSFLIAKYVCEVLGFLFEKMGLPDLVSRTSSSSFD